MTNNPKLLWQPSAERIKNSNMKKFMEFANKKYGYNFADYDRLYEWSVNNISEFWGEMREFADIRFSESSDKVIDDETKMPFAKWFLGAKLNFAENLLRYKDDKTAIIFKGEDKPVKKISYSKLYDNTARLALSLKEAGVKKGDRVSGFIPNMPEAVIAMLASTSLGAVWSSCSPDFGIKGVLDRFGQIKPKVLFVADGYFFKGKKIDSLKNITDIVKKLPSIEKVVVIPFTEASPNIKNIPNSIFYDDFISDKSGLQLEFTQVDFNDPLYIMYSSGTTGLPKCMVQSVGGVLINQMKEHILHTDLKREDTIFYFTTCGWMMWNWLVCALSVGASIVLFDGNPFYPNPEALWKLAEDEKISVFGTSAGYISALMNSGTKPAEKYNLSALRAVLSTGSPLSIEGFEYIYNNIKKDVQLASISGGSDLNGCFALGNPILPVYSGELQCRGLGMKVSAFGQNGKPVIGQEGELVCEAPFPSMPIAFWDDPDSKKYLSAYFDVYPGIWRHGDFIIINDRGGVVMHGRSDATLNPGGVRIGTAEIYRQLDQVEEINDSLVVGQNWENDIRVVLFVTLADGYKLTDSLKNKIKTTIKKNASPRHVPKLIIDVPDIPYTLNMKKVEIAVKKVIEGKPVLNKDSLKNPESLDYFATIKELKEK
ncbi:MAG: acetoacetate--CoA ligase [Deltaproteobacteria bacterium]|nr:acetoacetate--CoA ligase [Deltaproteobacteria bacterium]